MGPHLSVGPEQAGFVAYFHNFHVLSCAISALSVQNYTTTQNYVQRGHRTSFALYNYMSQAGPDAHTCTYWNSNTKSHVQPWKVTEFHWWRVCVLLLVRT